MFNSNKTHYIVVTHLLEQYQQLREQQVSLISQAVMLEARIFNSLFLLSHNILDNELEPESYIDCYIYLARRLLSSDKKINLIACQTSCHWLCELLVDDSSVRGLAAVDIVCQFKSNKMQQQLVLMFKYLKIMRSIVLGIWSKSSFVLTEDLMADINQEPSDAKLQYKVMEYSAYLHPVMQNKDKIKYLLNHSGRILECDFEYSNLEEKAYHCSKLFLGLQLDLKYTTTILNSILKKSPLNRDVLRLAAITGRSCYIDKLKSYAETNPDYGYYLLALHGSYQSIEYIVQATKNIKYLHFSAKSWEIVSGKDMPLMQKLSVVDNDSKKGRVNNLIPNAELIQQWWVDYKEKIQHAKRWLNGQEFGEHTLFSALNKYSGHYHMDLMFLYKLKTGNECFSCIDNGWYTSKITIYKDKRAELSSSNTKPESLIENV